MAAETPDQQDSEMGQGAELAKELETDQPARHSREHTAQQIQHVSEMLNKRADQEGGVVAHKRVAPDGAVVGVWNKSRDSDERVDVTKTVRTPEVQAELSVRTGIADDGRPYAYGEEDTGRKADEDDHRPLTTEEIRQTAANIQGELRNEAARTEVEKIDPKPEKSDFETLRDS